MKKLSAHVKNKLYDSFKKRASRTLPAPHFAEMENLINGGLLRKVTPPELEESLIRSGHVKRVVGGLVPTHLGREVFYGQMRKK